MLLETDRLLLRPLLRDDVPALVELGTDPEVTKFMGGPRNAADLQVLFERAAAEQRTASSFDLWPVVEKISDRVIGHCGLLEKPISNRAEVELTYVLSRAHWGRGYAVEIARALRDYATNRLGLSRLVALISPENEASIRVARKVGMGFESAVERPSGAHLHLYVLACDRSSGIA